MTVVRGAWPTNRCATRKSALGATCKSQVHKMMCHADNTLATLRVLVSPANYYSGGSPHLIATLRALQTWELR